MEFTITDDPQAVVKAEADKVKKELSELIQQLDAETKKAKHLEESKASKIKSAAKRRAIQKKHDSAVARAEDSLRSARFRSRKSLIKMSALEEEISETKVAKKRLKKLRKDVEDKSKSVSAHLTSLTEVLSGVMSVRSLVNVEEPILHTPDIMRWTTAPVFVFDKDGTPLKTEFGEFEISLSKTSSGSLTVSMKALTPNVKNSRFVHPHVTSDDRPCLGDASNQLMLVLNDNNLKGAILLVHNFLTHYNIRDPYTSIAWWEPDCLWHMPSCECGITTANNCNCSKCLCCGSVYAEDGGEANPSTTGCGSCGICCGSNHMRTDKESSKIPGSNCTHTYLNAG